MRLFLALILAATCAGCSAMTTSTAYVPQSVAPAACAPAPAAVPMRVVYLPAAPVAVPARVRCRHLQQRPSLTKTANFGGFSISITFGRVLFVLIDKRVNPCQPLPTKEVCTS
jgi:hypothetical protein